MRLPLFALAFAGMSCTVIAGESNLTSGFRSHPLTIDEAVQLALKQNPSILAANPATQGSKKVSFYRRNPGCCRS